MSASSPLAPPPDDFGDNPYASPLATGITPRTDAEALRFAHLSHEASIRSIGTLHYLGAALILLIWLPILAAAVNFPTPGGLMTLMVLGGLAVINIAVGRGLRRLYPSARIGAALFAVLGLLFFPIGTLISGYILYLLFSPKGNRVFSAEYQEVIRQTPDMVYRTSFGLIVAAVLLLVLLLAGFFGFLVRA